MVPFRLAPNFLTPEFKIQNLTLAREMEGRLDRRLEHDARLRRDAPRARSQRRHGGLDQFSQMAADMLTSPKARSAFDLSKEPDANPPPVRPACLGKSGLAGADAWWKPASVS